MESGLWRRTRKQGHDSNAPRSWKLHRELRKREGQWALQTAWSLDLYKHPRAWELSFSVLGATNRKEQGRDGAGADRRSCKQFPSTSGVSKGPPSVGTRGCNPGMPLNAEIPGKASKGSGTEGRKDAPAVGGHRQRTPSEGVRGSVEVSKALGAPQGSEPEPQFCTQPRQICRRHVPDLQPCLPHVGFVP